MDEFFLKVVGEGGEGERGRRVPPPLPGGGGCGAGVRALLAAPPEGAGVAGQAWEVEARVAASARSARRPHPPSCCGAAGRVSCPPSEPSVGFPAESRAPSGDGQRGPGRGRRRPCGVARSCGVFFSGWLLENRMCNEQCPIDRSPRGVYFLSLPWKENCTVQVGKV